MPMRALITWTSLLAVGIIYAAAAQDRPSTQPSDPGSPDPHRRRSTLYVTLRGAGEVVAFSRDSGEKIAAIEVGREPAGLAARRDGDRIYVASAGSHAVQIIDGASRTLLDTIALPHGSAPEHVALSPLQSAIYVAASGLDTVLAFDAGSLQQLWEAPVGRRPIRLAVSPDGRRVYVLCAGAGRLDILDAASGRTIGSVPAGSEASDLALDSASGALYVARAASASLLAIAEGSTQAREVSIDAPAESLAADPDTRRLVVAMPARGRIAVISPLTGAATRVIDAPDVSRLAVDPDGSTLYAVSARRGSLLIVHHVLGGVAREIPVGKQPWDIVLIP
jgi:DNA-binding beta-propeller fold protein YncE